MPTEALPITLAVNMQLAAVADIGDTLVFPPGYERALRYALAVELAPEYPAVTLSQRVIDTGGRSAGADQVREQHPECAGNVRCGDRRPSVLRRHTGGIPRRVLTQCGYRSPQTLKAGTVLCPLAR